MRWSESRQRFIAELTVGYSARGKKIVRSGSGRSESEALRNMRRAVKDYEAGLVPDAQRYTVARAVEDWLKFGQGSRAGEETRKKHAILCDTHIVPLIGGQKLQRLTVQQVDEWLEGRAEVLATRTVQEVRWCLNQSIRRAMAHGLAQRNVVELSHVPKGRRPGRPSKSLTLKQATDILTATAQDPMYAYIVVSLLTGVRTEEVRALRWDHLELDGDPKADPSVPPHVCVWRSVREGGDTKTEKSRRTLALPREVATVLRAQKARQAKARLRAGERWHDSGLVFTTAYGTPLDAHNVRRSFRRALGKVDGIDPTDWTPRELRHSFVSLMSEARVTVEEIARLVGHTGGSKVTERIYRHELRPVIETGAQVMDHLFGDLSKGRGAGA